MRKLTYLLSAIVAIGFAACGDDTTTINDGTQDSVKTVDGNTTMLGGYMRGTLVSGKTYTMTEDVIIPEGETLRVEPGVTVIVENDGSGIGPEFTINGTFAAIGSKNEPILFTIPEADRTNENLFSGYWNGFQARETAKALVLKWVKAEYLGGSGGPASPRAGKKTYGFACLDPNTEVIVEDCWFRGMVDDLFRPNGGKINLVRNVVEFAGETGGDGFNIKGGTVGNIAYNVFIGGATNAYKISNEGSSTVQTNVNVYNNVAVNCGFRRSGNTRGTNINYEVGARGYAYNNIVVNCKRGMRALEDADLDNIEFDHNLYYAAYDEMIAEKIPTDAVASTEKVLGANNIMGNAGENDPMFKNYNPTEFKWDDYMAGSTQPVGLNEVGDKNFALQSGSPCIGKGKTDFEPVSVNWTVTGDLAPDIVKPSKDLGACPTDGSGNQYFN